MGRRYQEHNTKRKGTQPTSSVCFRVACRWRHGCTAAEKNEHAIGNIRINHDTIAYSLVWLVVFAAAISSAIFFPCEFARSFFSRLLANRVFSSNHTPKRIFQPIKRQVKSVTRLRISAKHATIAFSFEGNGRRAQGVVAWCGLWRLWRRAALAERARLSSGGRCAATAAAAVLPAAGNPRRPPESCVDTFHRGRKTKKEAHPTTTQGIAMCVLCAHCIYFLLSMFLSFFVRFFFF